MALQEAQVSCAIRAFRSAIVKWWHNNLSSEVVRADAEQVALSIVEGDLLVKELWLHRPALKKTSKIVWTKAPKAKPIHGRAMLFGLGQEPWSNF